MWSSQSAARTEPRTPSRNTTTKSTPGTPVTRTNTTAATPGGRRMPATSARGRAQTSSYPSVEPADAPPGTPTSRAQQERPRLQSLMGLVYPKNTYKRDQSSGRALDVAVAIAGLEEGEAEALYAGALFGLHPKIFLMSCSTVQPS